MCWANVYNKCGYQYVKIGQHATLDEALNCVNEYGVYKYVGTVEITTNAQSAEITKEKLQKMYRLAKAVNVV